MTYLNTNRKEDCCGCCACLNICPKGAIDMVADDEGFFFPVKNDKCIGCGLCEKVCPYNSVNLKKEESRQEAIKLDYPAAFAAYGQEERVGSSSGGIFYALAKYIISKQGFVYGAAFDENFQLRHIAASTLEELQPLRGSKYLQSNIGLTFKEIKARLTEGKYVLFCGTPCQVAGLKSYLQKDYDTLLMADIICHGTPSQWMFDQHKVYLEKKSNANLVHYSFRNNAEWGVYEICNFVNPSTGKKWTVKHPTYELSPYLYSFMYAFDYRLSCYECPFAKVPRQGDITLGDYWGVEKMFPEMDASKGISSILVNTSQGMRFWNEIKEEIAWKQSTVKDVSAFNGNLIHSTNKPAIRDNAYKMVRERGYASVAEKEFRSPRYNIIRFKTWLKGWGIMKLVMEIYRKK